MEEAVSEDLDVLHVLGEDDDRHDLDEAHFDAAANRREAGSVKREPDHGDGWSNCDGADEPGVKGNSSVQVRTNGDTMKLAVAGSRVTIVRS